MKRQCDNPTEVAKEMFWLAWQACGGPLGMGILQDRPDATRDDVWNNIMNAGDYMGSPIKRGRADYVFGRMMKLDIEVGEDYVEFREDKPRVDYQAWCAVYSTYQDLFEAAAGNVTRSAE